MNTASIFFLILGLILVVAVIRLVRNLKLREKYAALWLLTAVVIAILMIFPKLLDSLSSLVGVVTPVNLLFLIGLVLLLGVCLHLSLEISRLEDETRVLAEEAAIQRSLLNRQLERVERNRNPTSSLPIIQVDDQGEPHSIDIHGSSAAGSDGHEDGPDRPSTRNTDHRTTDEPHDPTEKP
ncbi:MULTISPECIES: DUF2304 domain-containing protein [Micrococcaceae]|uniref:DUF2304 domain-containing protein n=1 Tax=unclassified Kocuria TaxID=2649579 RepID=UPI001012CCF8|nr:MULTISPECIES: DUF2304 domain-containing protein [unclassified Kocuria]